MKVLVTGGAGFIGSNFVRHLLTETDHSVVTVDALTYSGTKQNLEGVLEDSHHKFIEGDIRDQSLMTDVIQRVDAVVNFAAESHVDRSIEDASEFVATNVLGTQVLLDAARCCDIERFVQISTDEVYGQILEGKFSEEDSLNPRNPYSATKASADLLVQSYATTHGLPVVIGRPCNNFGPRQNTEKLIPKFITRAAAGKSLPVYGDGTNVREWMYVKDTCRALEHLLTNGDAEHIYNIGTGFELPNIAVTEMIIDAVGGSKEQIEFVKDRPGHDQRYALDTSKIRSLGWEPNWPFEEGLAETVEYYTQ